MFSPSSPSPRLAAAAGVLCHSMDSGLVSPRRRLTTIRLTTNPDWRSSLLRSSSPVLLPRPVMFSFPVCDLPTPPVVPPNPPRKHLRSLCRVLPCLLSFHGPSRFASSARTSLILAAHAFRSIRYRHHHHHFHHHHPISSISISPTSSPALFHYSFSCAHVWVFSFCISLSYSFYLPLSCLALFSLAFDLSVGSVSPASSPTPPSPLLCVGFPSFLFVLPRYHPLVPARATALLFLLFLCLA